MSFIPALLYISATSINRRSPAAALALALAVGGRCGIIGQYAAGADFGRMSPQNVPAPYFAAHQSLVRVAVGPVAQRYGQQVGQSDPFSGAEFQLMLAQALALATGSGHAGQCREL